MQISPRQIARLDAPCHIVTQTNGSGNALLNSIVGKLLVLDDDTLVLPGHGESSTIGAERRTNPFLEGLTL